MANNLWLSLLQVGLIANRPNAPEAASQFNQPILYYATDTNVMSLYSVSDGWLDISGSAGNVSTGLTASTTQTIAGALQLTGDYNNVTTVANAADAVGLPASVLGAQVWVTNSAATNAMGVFPKAGETGTVIDGGSAGAKVTISAGKSALFTCIATGVWQSIGSAARAA